MQTTSLEVSQELEKAGFWDERMFLHYWFWFDGECHIGAVEPEDWSSPNNMECPAATYDDLIPALGLDKPNKDYACSDEGSGGWTYYFDITVRDEGFTPDTLAKVWMGLKRRGCRNPAEVFPILDTWDKPSTWDKKGHKDGE